MTLPAADRLDILDVITRADAAASARDATAYLALFSDDPVLDGDAGTYRGVDALRQGLAAVWGSEPAGTLHLTLSPVIDDGPATADTAAARSVLLIIDQGPPPALVAMAHVTQQLRRGPAGWRITRRTVDSAQQARRATASDEARGGTVTDHPDNPDGPLSFERDIRPLFREKDRSSMLKAFDLWSYADVVAHKDAILDQVRGGHMPCDGAWPADRVSLLNRWMAQGSPA